MTEDRLLQAARTGDDVAFAGLLKPYERELHAHCYRMLGSVFDADDALQDAELRAWKALKRFEGRSSLRSWLYTIATNTCLTQIQRRPKRVLPVDYGGPTDPLTGPGQPITETVWLEPYPDSDLEDGLAGPEARYEQRESVELAFIAALQHLPATQRAVLVLREVLGFSAKEVAEAMETTVASVNSALQRARATLAERDVTPAPDAVDAGQRALLDRYMAAFESYDIGSLVSLLHEDATQSMPPYRLWLRGAGEIGRWMLGQGIGCRGSRLLATSANGCGAFGVYRPCEPAGHKPFSLQIVEVTDGRIAGLHNFLYPELFAAVGLPTRL
jgi:RNA polymerase sigma-70 factor (ECF subfamily)